jgi:hypothetical protein
MVFVFYLFVNIVIVILLNDCLSDNFKTVVSARFTMTANSFISATNMRLHTEFWRNEAGLLRVTGTINLPNNILNTKALGRKV